LCERVKPEKEWLVYVPRREVLLLF